jgi:RHS repeat-associated protein
MVLDRRRDGRTLTYAYDGAGNLSSLSDSAGAASRSYTYDTYGRVLTATGGGQTLTYTYDALGRTVSESGPLGTVTDGYDLNNNRTSITWPDGWSVSYTYDAASEVVGIADSSQALVGLAYDDLGRRTLLVRPNVGDSYYGYDGASNLSSLSIDYVDGTKNQNFVYNYNPAGQVRSSSASNSLYDYVPPSAASRAYAADGQNRYTTSGGIALSYDGRGDTANDTQMTYAYDSLNNLTSLGNGATLSYDPAGRLFQTVGSTTTRFLYEGSQMIGEYNASGVIQQRYVPGPNLDEPLVWYSGASQSGGGARQWLIADRKGSVIAVANASGTTVGVNTYDDSGMPGPANIGRFQYDGTPWIPEAGLYHMRARAYSPTLGRFMQPDPTGYADGLNFNAFAHNDPVNGKDPSGLGDPEFPLGDDVGDQDNYDPAGNDLGPAEGGDPDPPTEVAGVTVIGQRPTPSTTVSGITVTSSPAGGLPQSTTVSEVVVHAKPRNNNCLASALGKNGVTLGLDTVGAAASFLPGESQAVALGQIVLSFGALVNSGVGGDLRGLGLGIVGLHLAAVGPAAGQSASSTAASVGRSLARALPGVGTAFSIGALALDSATAYSDYRSCLSGGG